MPPPHPPVGRNLFNQRNKKDVVVSNGDVIPNTITCHVCKKSKPKSQYANRQLQKVSNNIHNPYAPAGRSLKDPKATCMTCTSQQTTELTCVICDKRKGLDKFAKAQRKNPATARCQICVEYHLAHEADDTPPDSDDYSESNSDSEPEDFDDPNRTSNTTKGVGKGKDRRGPAPLETEDGDNDWAPVQSAGAGATRTLTSADVRGPLPELSAAPSSTASSTYGRSSKTKKGWAKAPKVQNGKPAKGQEIMYGQTVAQETDEWTKYSQDLAKRREAPKNFTKKNRQQHHIDTYHSDDDEQWDG
ncbi:Stc1 domain-containing protein [Trichophaea hybrida]|nr:Stc1 domain-containing protein [Trichophaea hybrida]